MIKRGEIYLVNLNPKRGNEVGKLRPALILQTDALNEVVHPTVIVLPLSTKLIDQQILRFRITKRDRLDKDSDILCDQIRAIDIHRIVSEPLTRLSEEELAQVEERVKIILDLI